MYTHTSMWFGTQLSWFFLSSWKLLFHCQPHTKIVSQPCSPSPTVAERSESDKHMERVQCKLTPCFRLSLAWSATSDTITKAAATQTERGRQKIFKKRKRKKGRQICVQPNFSEDTVSGCESTTEGPDSWQTAASCFCQRVREDVAVMTLFMNVTELQSAGLPWVSSYSLESGERLFR